MEGDFSFYDIRLPAKGLRHGVDAHLKYLGNTSIMAAIGARSPYTLCSAVPGVRLDFHMTGDGKIILTYLICISNNFKNSRAHFPPLSLRRR